MRGVEKVRERIEFNEHLLKQLAEFLNKISEDLEKLLSEDELRVNDLDNIYVSFDEALNIFETVRNAVRRDLLYLRMRNAVR